MTAAGNRPAYDLIRDLELRLARYFFESEWNERSKTTHEHVAIFEVVRDHRAEEAAPPPDQFWAAVNNPET